MVMDAAARYAMAVMRDLRERIGFECPGIRAHAKEITLCGTLQQEK